MKVNYQLTGILHLPSGSTVRKDGRGVILPDGRLLKLWECWEEGEGAIERLQPSELEEMGVFFDGPPARFGELAL